MIVRFYNLRHGKKYTIVECRSVDISTMENGWVSIITYPDFTTKNGVERKVSIGDETGNSYDSCFIYSDSGLLINLINDGTITHGQ